jgi:queuosine precursor transporter
MDRALLLILWGYLHFYPHLCYNIIMKESIIDKNPALISQLPAVAFIATAVYTASNIFANILSVKMAALPFAFPFNEVDAGSIIFPLVFIVRDMLHKNAGRKLAATVVLTVAGINVAMVLLFNLVAIMPAADRWAAEGGQAAFELIIVPAGRIALASIVAQVISGLTNTYVFSKVIRTNPLKKDIIASLLSNAIAITFDTIIFAFVAFAGPDIPLQELISIIVVNIVFKFFIALIGAPLVRLIKVQVDPSLL